jgi:hypothetical protein
VYELRDSLEIIQLDLCLFNICNEDAIYSLPPSEKKRACRLALDDMLEIIKEDKRQFGFRVWLES